MIPEENLLHLVAQQTSTELVAIVWSLKWNTCFLIGKATHSKWSRTSIKIEINWKAKICMAKECLALNSWRRDEFYMGQGKENSKWPELMASKSSKLYFLMKKNITNNNNNIWNYSLLKIILCLKSIYIMVHHDFIFHADIFYFNDEVSRILKMIRADYSKEKG